MQDTKPEIVRKGNLLIASKLNLTRNESRVLELVFAQINPFEDVSFQKQYRVEVVDLVKIKKNNKVYMELEDIANGLTSKNIHLRQEDGSFEFLTITNMVKYDADEGAIFVELNNNLLTYLLKSPKQIESEKKQLELKEKKDRIDALKTEKAGWAYTSYQLKYHLILQSNHALRFYELLKQYESIGKRVLYVEEIKILLEIETRYNAYADFKRNVILIAQKELKSKTDICFDFEEIKKRRRVYAIRFTIYKNNRVEEGLSNKSEPKVESQQEFLNSNFDDTIAELKKLKKPSDEEITDQKALQLINRFGEEHIKKCISLLQMEDKSTKNNFVGFVIKAIENNWLDDKILEIGRKEKKVEKNKEKKQEEERQKREEEYIDNLFGKYWENQLELLLASVNIDTEVSNYLETKENLREYRELKIDLENRNIYSMNWSLFIGWLQEQNPQVKFLTKAEFKNRYYTNKNLKPVDKIVVNKKNDLPLFSQDELVGRIVKKDTVEDTSKRKATKIPISDIQELAKELNCSVEEVIAKNGYNIEGDFAVKYDI